MSSILELKAQLAVLQSMKAESEDDAAIAAFTTRIASIEVAVAELVSNLPMEIAPTTVSQNSLSEEKQIHLARVKEPEKPMFSGTSLLTVMSLLQTSAKINVKNDEIIFPAKGKLY